MFICDFQYVFSCWVIRAQYPAISNSNKVRKKNKKTQKNSTDLNWNLIRDTWLKNLEIGKSKTQKPRKAQKSPKFLSEFFLRSFRFWVLDQNQKVGREKVGKSFWDFRVFRAFRVFNLDTTLFEPRCLFGENQFPDCLNGTMLIFRES